MNATESYHRFLISRRVYCESGSCLEPAKVVRKIDNRDTVLCYEHDPENGFVEWLEATNDAMAFEDRDANPLDGETGNFPASAMDY